MNSAELIKHIESGALDSSFSFLYGENEVKTQKKRYISAINSFVSLFGDGELNLFSVPGRSEISGNHTDHNYGKVIAASVNCDIIAVVKRTNDNVIKVQSEGFPCDTVNINNLNEYEKYTSSSLICGTCAGFLNNGHKIGGFTAYTTSNVLKGSGLSSSAAFEVMIGTILNHLYNDNCVSAVEIAKIAQFAENKYFGKPCGLMDQTACSVGGLVYIDFADPKNPIIEKLEFSLEKYGYALCIVNTGGNHADLTPDYAAVPSEMKAVAAHFNKEVLRTVSLENIIDNAKELRSVTGDRAILRALHYKCENERVDKIVSAVKNNDISAFLCEINRSGNSSFKYLQNVYTTQDPSEQGISLALALSEVFAESFDSACVSRVHGGGFAGTIQAFVKATFVKEYKAFIEKVFGEGSCMIMSVRPVGAVKVI